MDDEIIRINFPVNEHNCNTVDLTDTLIRDLIYNLEVVQGLTIDDLNKKYVIFLASQKTVLFEQVNRMMISKK